MIVGYARVSTVEQSLEIQEEKLRSAGVEKLFSEKLSGSFAGNRQQLQLCLDFVREGDVLVVTRLDRIARSSLDLHNIIAGLQDKGVEFRCTEQSGVDTTSVAGKLMIGLLGAVAEFENGLRKERQMEGIAKAKAAGVYKGRKRTVDAEAVQALATSGEKPAAIARQLGISRMSVYRVLQG